jgi:hypothetical protein
LLGLSICNNLKFVALNLDICVNSHEKAENVNKYMIFVADKMVELINTKLWDFT